MKRSEATTDLSRWYGRAPVLSRRLIVSASIVAGLVSGGLGVRYLTQTPEDVLAIAPVDPALCRVPGTGGWAANSVFFRIAAAEDKAAEQARPRTEVKPFDYAVEGTSPAAQSDPWLWDNLGSMSFPITTARPEAQRFFDQGLRLAYAFNHAEALRAFRMAQKLDPQCAMCFWGEAYVLGPNINAPMDETAVAPAFAAITHAQSLAGQASPREQALIEAMAKRYSPDPKADRAALDAAYATAMGKARAQLANDADVLTMFAESVMDLTPWDYWLMAGTQPKGQMGEAIAALEQVIKTNRNHPGAIHFYIHAVEASTDPRRAEAHAERLGALMPGAGHLVHMPSHIYYRVGRYRDSLDANRKAVAIDEAYLAKVDAKGAYPAVYYPHNVHFLLASAQMAGDGETVITSAEKLGKVIPDDVARSIPIAESIKGALYFAHAQFSDPQTILALPEPGDGMPMLKGIWHYARGSAYASRGDVTGAQSEVAALADMIATADFTALTAAGVPAKDVMHIARHVILSRIARAQGNTAAVVNELRIAVALQDALPYMEPPYWYYPVRQSLGAALLTGGDVDGAEMAFRESLARTPNNGWSLYGLSEVYRKRGDQRGTKAAEELLSRAWVGPRSHLDLARL